MKNMSVGVTGIIRSVDFAFVSERVYHIWNILFLRQTSKTENL